MNKIQITTRVSSKTKKIVSKICKSKGISISRFIEEAILDKLEELEDLVDTSEIKKLRKEKSRPFDEVIRIPQ